MRTGKSGGRENRASREALEEKSERQGNRADGNFLKKPNSHAVQVSPGYYPVFEEVSLCCGRDNACWNNLTKHPISGTVNLHRLSEAETAPMAAGESSSAYLNQFTLTHRGSVSAAFDRFLAVERPSRPFFPCSIPSSKGRPFFIIEWYPCLSFLCSALVALGCFLPVRTLKI